MDAGLANTDTISSGGTPPGSHTNDALPELPEDGDHRDMDAESNRGRLRDMLRAGSSYTSKAGVVAVNRGGGGRGDGGSASDGEPTPAAHKSTGELGGAAYSSSSRRSLSSGSSRSSHMSDLSTATTSSRSKKESKLQNSFTWSEFIAYVAFIVLFMIVTIGGKDDISSFYYTELLRDLFVNEEFSVNHTHILKTFNDIGEMEEFWHFVEGPFLNGLFPTEYYNGQPFADHELGFIYGYNYIVGAINIRQVRVRPDSCNIPAAFADSITNCYAEFTAATEDTEPFGPDDKYTYQSEEDIDGEGYFAQLQSYTGGGYQVTLPSDRAGAEAVIYQLKNDTWLDRQTRAVFFDFSVYNAHINLFCIVRMVVEWPASGGGVPFHTFRTVRLFRYEGGVDTAFLVAEILLCVFIVYYIADEFREGYRYGLKAYLQDAWNYLDIVNLGIFVAVIVIRINWVSQVAALDLAPGSSVNLQTLGFWIDQERNLNAFNAFLTWFKLFKYLQANSEMSQLSRTLSGAAWPLLVFLFMFFIVFLGFAQAAYMAFSVDVFEYRTFGHSMYTLFQSVLGEFDFEALRRSNRVLGPLFFTLFQVLVVFFLMNMFLAIINQSYERVLSIDNRQKHNVFKSIYHRIFKTKDEAEAAKADLQGIDRNDDGRVDAEEARRYVARHKHVLARMGVRTPAELISEFDANKDGFLEAEEVDALRSRISNYEQEAEAELSAKLPNYMQSIDNQVLIMTDLVSQLTDEVTAIRAEKETLQSAIENGGVGGVGGSSSGMGKRRKSQKRVISDGDGGEMLTTFGAMEMIQSMMDSDALDPHVYRGPGGSGAGGGGGGGGGGGSRHHGRRNGGNGGDRSHGRHGGSSTARTPRSRRGSITKNTTTRQRRR